MKKKDKNPETPVTEEEAPQTAEQPQNTGETAGEQPEEKEASIDEWRAALETAVKQRDEYLDQLRRSQADFQNFKRRNQTARSDGYMDGTCDVITAALPAIDNLERALGAAPEGDPLAEGVRMTLKLMLDSLSRFGFEEVPALGEEFDPEKHNAVMREQTDDPGKVLKARLTAAGADMSRVMVVTSDAYFARTGSPLCIPDTSFAKYVGKAAPALVIIDPLQSFLPAGVEMASRNQMRSALLPLKALCARHGCAALISMHTNKRANVSGRARLADSSDIWDIARSVLMMGRDKNSEKLYLSHEKSSYSAPARTALLHIEQAQVEGVKTAVAVFDSRTDKKDADFVEERRVRTAQTKEDTAQAILNVLAESKLGSMPSTQLRAEVMKEMGCSEKTYNRAYSELAKSGEIKKQQFNQKNGTRGWFTFLGYCSKTNDQVTI